MTSKGTLIGNRSDLLLEKKMRVLVTGANGFVGSTVCDFLTSAGYEVVGVVRNKIDLSSDNRLICQKDLENTPEILETFHAVIHLAARVHIFTETSPNSRQEYEQVNRSMTLNLARKCVAAGIQKFIFASSISIFGRFFTGYIDPLCDPVPDDYYGTSKWEAEQDLMKLFSEQDRSQCIIFRLPMIYGPKNKGNMSHFLKAASLGLPLPLGRAKGKRSMIYIKNVCDAMLAVIQDKKADRPQTQTFFINDGQDLTSGELYELIYQAYRKKRGLVSVPTRWLQWLGTLGSTLENIFSISIFINKRTIARLLEESRFSSEKFSREYGWVAPYNPQQGIVETVKWYKRQSYSH